MNVKYSILAVFIGGLSLAFGQKKINFMSDDSIRTTTAELIEKKDFNKVISFLSTINTNDSIYSSLQITKSYYQIQLKQYQEAIKTAVSLRLPSSYNQDHLPTFLPLSSNDPGYMMKVILRKQQFTKTDFLMGKM